MSELKNEKGGKKLRKLERTTDDSVKTTKEEESLSQNAMITVVNSNWSLSSQVDQDTFSIFILGTNL